MKTKRKMSSIKKLKELQAFVGICFGCLEDLSYKQIARKMGVHPSTVRRLHRGEFTRCVRFGTIQELGLVAGIEIRMDDYQAELRVVRAA